MRKFVSQMMTTLNGRIDDPFEWMTEMTEDHYDDVEAAYSTFDTVIVGRVTCEEMSEFWPTALNDSKASQAHRKMAEHMHRYRKLVVTSDAKFEPNWNNAETVVAKKDADILALVDRLRSEPGANVHVSGGARLAQTFARLNLIDAYRLYVVPVVSAGQTLFAKVEGKRPLSPTGTKTFRNGITVVQYAAVRGEAQDARPKSFNELVSS